MVNMMPNYVRVWKVKTLIAAQKFIFYCFSQCQVGNVRNFLPYALKFVSFKENILRKKKKPKAKNQNTVVLISDVLSIKTSAFKYRVSTMSALFH